MALLLLPRSLNAFGYFLTRKSARTMARTDNRTVSSLVDCLESLTALIIGHFRQCKKVNEQLNENNIT